ncbi:hypothetical protein [Prauserella endophytica]|uniref:Uncharacterized protein n=1 Tax=Prauserella endophytica TaxID=1592324 RepID=A0ABY2S0H8_9PSEU|nr:hypothetical protein [Prauserella endophytica]TKG67022.1 hypothetical protein FCN18_24255 [Prauserella endophytica]
MQTYKCAGEAGRPEAYALVQRDQSNRHHVAIRIPPYMLSAQEAHMFADHIAMIIRSASHKCAALNQPAVPR